jgi:hypothetical protein
MPGEIDQIEVSPSIFFGIIMDEVQGSSQNKLIFGSNEPDSNFNV